MLFFSMQGVIYIYIYTYISIYTYIQFVTPWCGLIVTPTSPVWLVAILEHFASGGRVSSHVSKVQQLQANDGAFAALTEQGATTGIGFNRQGKSQGEVAEVSLFFGVGHVMCFVWSWCFLCVFLPTELQQLFGTLLSYLWGLQNRSHQVTVSVSTSWNQTHGKHSMVQVCFFLPCFSVFFKESFVVSQSSLKMEGCFSRWPRHDTTVFMGVDVQLLFLLKKSGLVRELAEHVRSAPFTTAPRCFNTRWNAFSHRNQLNLAPARDSGLLGKLWTWRCMWTSTDICGRDLFIL